MTVQELIDELKKYEPEAKVVILKNNDEDDFKYVGQTKRISSYYYNDPDWIGIVPEAGPFKK